jgi:uncharacterized membrane protein
MITASAAIVATSIAILELPCRRKIDVTRSSIIAVKVNGITGLIAGVIGSVAGTFGGAKARGFLAKMFGRDLPAAGLEDLVAIGITVCALFR